ncbi:MAG: PLP-dependent aminotransferase family protein [Actinobacteria bacterium]|nr:MAG: PLP-dependent aminotransferase family protein [Actinomycetota bacterium]
MDTISLARGVPAPECIPVAELADCAAAAIERDGTTVLSYGPVGGYQPLREWIADRHGVEPSRVLVTNGSLQGLAFLADRFAGARVLVEQPTYDRPLKLLAARGADVVAVPMDDDGLDLDALAQTLDTGPKPAFLYTIPTFQNPSGRTLTTERRHRLVELARERDLLVLEDDPYGLVRFEGDPPPTLFELDGGDHVVYSSSFSKTVAPGVRVGYFVLPQALDAELEALAVSTYITPVLLGQATVFEFLRRGNFEANIERVRDLLHARRDAMLDALEQDLPSAKWTHPAGGYFVWVELPDELKEAAGVAFVSGTDFGGAPNTARLAFSYVSPDEIREGISRLSAAVAARGEAAAAAPASRGYGA